MSMIIAAVRREVLQGGVGRPGVGHQLTPVAPNESKRPVKTSLTESESDWILRNGCFKRQLEIGFHGEWIL
jgi:hypothetical protein